MIGLLLFASLAIAQDQPAAAVGTHSGVSGLVLTRPFTLAQPTTFFWVKEQPSYDAGWLVVVRVDPELVRPRQVGVPVLYAGTTPVELLNDGYPSGVVIGLVPASVDLEHAPIFFGPTTLPERVDAAYGAEVLATANARGFAGPSAAEWAAARTAGGFALHVDDRGDLQHQVADLIDAYAPSEHERAETYRLTP
jgi:hypothetical protein